MEYSIENEFLKVTVGTKSAQVCSVLCKEDGVEHIWEGDPSLWGWHSPILFPYTGRLTDSALEAKGRRIENMPSHGIARQMEHTLLEQKEQELIFELRSNEETLALFPYAFSLRSVITLSGRELHHTLEVLNLDSENMPFGLGFHPAFALPFDELHQATDYELRFPENESPLCLGTLPTGLIHGDCYYLGKNIRAIPVDEKLFQNDSHCVVNFRSKAIRLCEKNSNRAVECRIEGFPYVLLWSMPGMPRFLCIEPWMSLPSDEWGSADWNKKPAAAIIAPGESWKTTMVTSYLR